VRTLTLLLISLVLIAVVAAATGGVNSPLLGLFYVPLVLAGFLSIRRAALCAAVATALFVGLATLRAPTSWPAALEVPTQAVLFFLVATVTAGVTRHARRDQGRLHAAADEARNALDVQHMISTAYDLDVTLDLVTLKQRDLLPAHSYAVLLAENEVLTIRASSGLGDAPKVRIGVNDEDQGWRPADGKSLVIADTSASPSRFAEIDPSAKSILVAPLQSVERLVGLLFFGSEERDAFPASAVDLAETFGNRMVFPIQRAQLEGDLRRLAFTDAQTSLYNHRHFQGQLDEEVRRAQRYGRPVSVIMMDIDNFKRFNDTWGHPAGDRILQGLSRVLKENLRTVDIPARYGGEEFVIICPETHAEHALALADRLRATIASTAFDLGDGRSHTITVSVGVAAFPAHADTKGALVDAADQALYEAKRSGKNRVVAHA
jgi:diguanylate cyclase (GGDEF)-like protein